MRGPRSVWLDLTYACNLHCVHCCVTCLHAADREELSVVELGKLFDALRRAGTKRLTITGGEPSVRPDWLLVAREAARRFRLSVYTNATLVTPEAAQALAELRPRVVEVSVYGATAAVYESVTQVPGSFERFEAGLGHLRAAGLPVAVKAVLLRESIGQWRQMADRYGGGEGLRMGLRVAPAFDGSAGPADHRADDTAILEHLCQAGPGPVRRLRGPSEQPCGVARRVCVLSPYGDVFPCGMMPRPVGNVRQEPFSRIWRSSALAPVRALRMSDLAECMACDARAWCRPCPGMNYLERGDMCLPAPELCQLAALRRRAAELAGPEPGAP